MEKPELTNGRRWLFATVLDELVGSELEGGEGHPAQRQRLNFLSKHTLLLLAPIGALVAMMCSTDPARF